MQNLENVRQRMVSACETAHRSADEVTLVAVSKKHSASRIRQVFEQGQRHFGENQLQEALEKQGALNDLDICWHFIGTIQSNKTREIASGFSWVQSVDREKILKRLSEQRPPGQPALNICLQVNIDREPQKSGLMPEQVPAMAELTRTMPNIRLRGLMAIPRATDDETRARSSFHKVRQLYDELCKCGFALDTLSMGMSSDLEAAIAEGSTMIRIGTDIFGQRA